jgi:hypothetical protein
LVKILNPSLAQIFGDLDAARAELHRRRIGLADGHPHWTHPTDARIVMVARMEGLAQSALLGIAYAGAYMIDPDWWRNVSDGDHSTQRQAVEGYELFIRSSFLTSLFATFENGCRILLRHLRPDAPGLAEKPAYAVTRELRLLLPTIPSEAWPLVDLLRHTRNTIHNNGVVFDSTSRLREVQYSGVTYQFEHGRHIEFATWSFLTRRFLELGILSCLIAASPQLASSEIIVDPAYR